MKLLKMPSGIQQCLLYSLAMLLDEEVDDLIQELGHNGMVRTFDQLIPYCYNGHHIQEIIDVFLRRGIFITPIELYPRYASARAPTDFRMLWPEEEAQKRFWSTIKGQRGLLLSNTHACAWDGAIVWDPIGRTYGIEEFNVRECWIIDITS